MTDKCKFLGGSAEQRKILQLHESRYVQARRIKAVTAMVRSTTSNHNPKKRTILLTGGTGFLGAHLVIAFLAKGYQVKVLVRTRNHRPESLRFSQALNPICAFPLPIYLRSGYVELLAGDVTARHFGLSSGTILKLSNEVTDIVHCAAMVSFNPSKAPELMRVNVQGTKNILELATGLKAPVLHYVSTAFVAGRKQGLVQETSPEGKSGFNNAYEESKFLAELEVRKAMTAGLPAVIYRPSILVGNSQTGQTQSSLGFYTLLRALALVARRARRLLERHPGHIDVSGLRWEKNLIFIPLRVEGSESKTLNIVPIDHVVQTMLAIFRDGNSVGKTFHLVNFKPPTIGQLRDQMCETLGMSGVSLVAQEGLKWKLTNRWERLFAKNTEEYAAYLNGKEPVFQADNTLHIIRREEIPQPVTDANFIRLLTTYCQQSHWGRRRVKLQRHAPPLQISS